MQSHKHQCTHFDVSSAISKKNKELMDSMKNEFISTVSHELRTPLTAIKGWGETIRSAKEDDVELIEKGINVIVNESERLTDLVEELLDFSRMESGKLTLKVSKLDIVKELTYAISSMGICDGKEDIFDTAYEKLIDTYEEVD